MASRDAQYDPAQLVLDFSSQLDGRRRQLRAALKRLIWPDLRCWSLCLWILHVENEHGGLVRDYDELADALWCDRSTVIRLVNRLMESELIRLGQTFDKDGAARKNEYRLNWIRIVALTSSSAVDLGLRVNRVIPDGAGSHERGPLERQPPERGPPEREGVPSQFATTQWQNATTQCQNATSYKEQVLSGVLGSEDPYPDSGVSADSGSAENFPSGIKTGNPGRQPRGPASVPDELVKKYPLLAEAGLRQLTELPADRFYHGVFKPLEDLDLASVQRIIDWHRRQLTSAYPVLSGSEAELLLTVAATCLVKAAKPKEVRENRVAMFVSLIHGRRWLDVMPYLPAARAILDSHAEKAGRAYWREPSPAAGG